MINISITIDNDTNPTKLKKNLEILFDKITNEKGTVKNEPENKDYLKELGFNSVEDFMNSEEVSKIFADANVKFNSEV